jgi:hypothetical protein
LEVWRTSRLFGLPIWTLTTLPSLPFQLMVWSIRVERKNTPCSTKTPVFMTTSTFPVVSIMRSES